MFYSIVWVRMCSEEVFPCLFFTKRFSGDFFGKQGLSGTTCRIEKLSIILGRKYLENSEIADATIFKGISECFSKKINFCWIFVSGFLLYRTAIILITIHNMNIIDIKNDLKATGDFELVHEY